ncbi:MAG: NIL domain-containing protein [Candidatus Omnitrophica bacterium]|nr:NIL domain-containing protein [Candidatus Omnitrophota bacterium]
MAIQHLKMVFPQHLMDEPVLFRMVKAFDVMPNIRRAKVSAEGGEIVLDLSGEY